MNICKKTFTVIIATLMTVNYSGFAQNFGLQVKDNKITYNQDELGNRILDYSYCGYKSSNQTLPTVSNVIFVPLNNNDASDRIQRAINYIAGLKPDANGIRGAVLLDKGTYKLSKNLMINTSGIVIRGKSKTETILLKEGFDRSALIKIEGVNYQINSEATEITTKYLAVNQMEFTVSDTKNLKVGDRIKIFRPSTKEWITSIGCDIFGGGISALGWKPGDNDIYWDRTIKAINANTITIDAPLSMALDSKFGVSKVFKYNWQGRISESGVENLTLTSAYNLKYPKDEDHCWTGISIENAENCWVSKVNFSHFAGNAVFLQPTASKITVEDCISRDPVSEIGGFRRVSFFNMGQLNLIQRCYSENGIHDFAVGFLAPGPNAFVQCEAKNAFGFSGSIDAWACGLLFDIVEIDGHNLTFKNLGQDKNGAGWNTANSLFWQCSAAEIECYSPAADAKNRAYGCWAQFSGNGEWAESNNHVYPRSLFYGQLAERLNKDISVQAAVLNRSTNASSSPTVEAAAEMVKEAFLPRQTLENWINQQQITASTNSEGLVNIDNLKTKAVKMPEYKPTFAILNGKIACDNQLVTGGVTDVPWWNGKTKFNYLEKMKPHITRFVPGREGYGLTDRIDSVISYMKTNKLAVIHHNYALWYERRRDDHERIRRRDGDVWGPLYDQPFARSGQGTAWDGLSKYDLYRPNEWYWMRLKEYADKAERNGLMLFHESFFQHNIIEAGAHWVDSPWRTANNINDTQFPEPVNFAGDKRVFMAEYFYDITNENRRNAYRNYIRQSLNAFSENKNVIFSISAEYTGPLHFMQFWLDVIDEWQKETGKNAMVALSCTKDVQDAILADSKRAAIVDIIDIRYWHYNTTGLYAPAGGQNLAPRQHARLVKVGSTRFDEVYKAVSEYRTKYPDKAVTYYSQNYPEFAVAVLMAGGSTPSLSIDNVDIKNTCTLKDIEMVNSDNYSKVVKSDKSVLIYAKNKDQKIAIDEISQNYKITFIDLRTNKTIIEKVKPKKGVKAEINTSKYGSGLYLIQKI